MSTFDRLVGTWKSCDGFSEIEFSIEFRTKALAVSAIDRDDGEAAEVLGVAWEDATSTLSFSLHWPSSGRLVKYRVMPSPSKGRLDVTFTYTAQDLWERVRSG